MPTRIGMHSGCSCGFYMPPIEFHVEGAADVQPPMKPIGSRLSASTTSSNGPKCSGEHPKSSTSNAWMVVGIV